MRACRLLNDDAMGGGKAGGHAMVVALHLYKLLKSSRRFTELMTKNFETTIKGVDCLIPFNDRLKVQILMGGNFGGVLVVRWLGLVYYSYC